MPIRCARCWNKRVTTKNAAIACRAGEFFCRDTPVFFRDVNVYSRAAIACFRAVVSCCRDAIASCRVAIVYYRTFIQGSEKQKAPCRLTRRFLFYSRILYASVSFSSSASAAAKPVSSFSTKRLYQMMIFLISEVCTRSLSNSGTTSSK
ncbi:MAG: hypothetical protein H6Q17_2409 [Bacteroidetes bacterium]|nr:hypothetical protein [Bacteroidota bacterium]